MRRTRSPFMRLLGCVFPLLVWAGSARADSTPATTISVVWQYASTANSGNTYLYLKGVTCTPPGSAYTYFIMPATDPMQSALLSVATAAYITKKPVVVEYNPSNCHVRSIALHTP